MNRRGHTIRRNRRACVAEKTLSGDETLPVECEVPYTPGRLEAVAFHGTVEIGRRQFDTAGAPSGILLSPEQSSASAERGRLAYVGINVTDAKDQCVPDSKHKLRLAIAGPAKLVGFGSANPFAQPGFQSNEAETYDGRALAIPKADGTPGLVQIAAESEGLRPGSAAIRLTNPK